MKFGPDSAIAENGFVSGLVFDPFKFPQTAAYVVELESQDFERSRKLRSDESELADHEEYIKRLRG